MTDNNNPPKHGYKSGASRPQLSLSTNRLASSTRSSAQLSPLQELTMDSEPDSGATTGNQPPIGPAPDARPRRPSHISHSRQSSRASAASDAGREPREHRSRRESTASQASDVQGTRRRESESRHGRHSRTGSVASRTPQTGEVQRDQSETRRHRRTESTASQASETRQEQGSSRSRRESNVSSASDAGREQRQSTTTSGDLPLRQGAQPPTAIPQSRRQHRPQPIQTQPLRVPQPLPGQFLPNYDPATGGNPFVNTPMDGFDHTPGPFTPITEHRFPARSDDRTPRASAFNRASGANQNRSQRGDPALGGLTEDEFNRKYDSNYRAGRDTYDPRSRGRRNQAQNRNNVPAHPLSGGRGAPPTSHGMQPSPNLYPPPAFSRGYGHPSPGLTPQGYGNPYVQPSPTFDPYLGAYPAGQPGPVYPLQGGFSGQQPGYGSLGGHPGGWHGGAPRPPAPGHRAITIRAPGEQPRTILSPVAPTFNPTEVPIRQQAGRDRGERQEASRHSTAGRREESRHSTNSRREESRHSSRTGRDDSRHSTKSRKEEDGKSKRK